MPQRPPPAAPGFRQVTIENPILNSPYREPGRHFLFDDEGITNTVAEGRRPSTYFIPIPRPRSRSAVTQSDWYEERKQSNKLVDQIREHLKLWREQKYPNVTYTTRKLLEYWTDPKRENKLFFCQIEAVETAIYLLEVAGRAGDTRFLQDIQKANTEANPELLRMAFKMATGSGKTVVMAMLIAWQALNKILNKQDARFSDAFLIVTPGITIRDRLRVLLPNDPGNYYQERDILPPDLLNRLLEAKIVITNFHAFRPRTLQEISRVNKAVLLGREKNPEPGIFTEDEAKMVRRVLREFGNKKDIIVINDEAHHCYRRKAAEEDGEKLKGEERKEAEKRDEAARIWISGLEAIKRRVGVKMVYDLSATPFFLQGSGYTEGTLFGWVVSDFSLIDSIEAGIVKIPRVPVEDSRMDSKGPTFRSLWLNIRDKLPKKGRGTEKADDPEKLPIELQQALESLYNNYKQYYDRWERVKSEGSTPPVFIVVCNNTNVSNLVHQYIAGYDKLQPDGTTRPAPGKFSLFSNVKNGEWLSRPNTILVDSEQLDSEGAMTSEFKKIATREIEEFKTEYRKRFPDRDVEKLTDEDLLREVMNTVGKPGKLGAEVRCVVSVSMLTEGWDANTVTHILGVRAFGTQLLCEQVVGRGLRRVSYGANADGMFEPEYAEVYGVPFTFIPTAGSGVPPEPKHVTHVHAIEEREHLKITFPRVQSYKYEFPERRLEYKFTDASKYQIRGSEHTTWTEVAGIVGATEKHNLDWYRGQRMQRVAFEVAKATLARYFTKKLDNATAIVGEGMEGMEFVDSTFFPQVLAITRNWLGSQVRCDDDAFPQLLLFSQPLQLSAEKIYSSIVGATNSEKRIMPRMRDFDPIGSTEFVRFDTARPTYITRKSHVSHVVCDTNSWEQKLAQFLESRDEVISYVKNDHLGFTIPYTYANEEHEYNPDFIVRLRKNDGSILNLIVEVSGEDLSVKEMKVNAVRTFWLPAIHNACGYGEWDILEVKNPYRVVEEFEEQLNKNE